MKLFRALALIVTVLCLLVLPIVIGDPTIASMAIDVLLLTGAAVAWNIFSGYMGYISLGHATYYGLGAYLMALICQDRHIPGGYGPFLLLPLAGLAAGAFAVPLGWIVLHARRHTFMVITIAIFFIFQLLAYDLQGLTDGSEGIFLPIPDWSSDLFNLPFYYVAGAFLLLVTLVSWWIRHSKFGLLLLAIRDDEDRTCGLGVRTGRYKLGAYVLAATLIGRVGALAVYFMGFTNPSTAFDQGFDLIVVVVSFLGGVGTVMGPIVGGLLLVPIQTYLILQFGIGATGFEHILFVGFLLVVILLLPEGVVPSLRKRWQVWKASRTQVQTRAMEMLSPSFTAISVDASERHDFVDVKGTREQTVPMNQASKKIAWAISPIPGRQSVMLHPPLNVSQRVKVQHLVPLSPHEFISAQESAVAFPGISWRCPSCRRPFLLQGNICYCPRCGFTRQLTEGIS